MKITNKHLLFSLAMLATVILSSCSSKMDYLGGSVNEVASTTSAPDLAIAKKDGSPAIYLDSSNKLYISHANIGNVDVTVTTGRTDIYIYKNSDLTTTYKKLTYYWSTLKDKNFLKAGGYSLINPLKLDSKNYTVQACIDPSNVATNESNEAGSFDCAAGSSVNNFLKVNLAGNVSPTVSIKFDAAHSEDSAILSPTGDCSSTNYDCYKAVAYFDFDVNGDLTSIEIQDFVITDNGDDNSSVYTDFVLKNSLGEFIANTTMSHGLISFANIDYNTLDSKEDLKFVVYAKVADITSISNTGAKLQLAISSASDVNIINKANGQTITPAVTAAANYAVNQTSYRAYASIPNVEMIPLSNTELVIGGDREIFKFSVTADNSGDIYLSRLVVDIESSTTVFLQDPQLYELPSTNTGEQLNEPVIYESAGQIVADDGADSDTIKDWTNGEDIVFDFVTPFRISAGATKTFIVEADINDTAVSGTSELKLKLLGDDKSIASDSVNDLDNTYNFIWSDGTNAANGDPDSETANQWTNGWKVPGLPSLEFKLSKLY